MQQLQDILDIEFERISENPGEFRTGLAQAKKLGISGPQLSRYRNGIYTLSPATAAKWATILRKGGSPTEIDELSQQLQQASKLTSDSRHRNTANTRVFHSDASNLSVQQAKELFQRLGDKGPNLLCVKYGDMPQALDGLAHADLGEVAGQAVANGLNFALFQPFHEIPSGPENQLSPATRIYLRDHRDYVRSVFREMRAIAIESAEDKADISSRIVLYERIPQVVGQFDHSPLVQTRMFYCEFHDGNSKQPYREVWEWVAAKGEDDLFVQRLPESLPKDFGFDLHQPVTGFFRREQRLPSTENEMREAFRLVRKDTRQPRPRFPEVWKIYNSDDEESQ